MREMIKKEWQLSDEETFHILRKGKNGVLATVDAEGHPLKAACKGQKHSLCKKGFSFRL